MGASPSQFAVDARRRELSLGRLAEPLRDIARGGLAGLLTGILVAGIGGRIVMRAAALLVPESAGQFTENGNRIGEITLGGSFALVLFGGLFFGLAGATIWVVVSPWIPGGARRRAVLSMPVAVALTGTSLVQADNPDFVILRHDGVTVVLLLVLVALAGLSIAGFDRWLDRRLPAAATSARADATYLVLTLAGGVLILPIVVQGYLGEELPLALVLIGVAGATLVHWTLRFQRRRSPPPWLIVVGRGSLLVAVVLGVVALAPNVASALGMR
jgi:hypothetical protein